MSPVIELEDVHKSFGPRAVLKQLNLAVPARSTFAFLGNNGQGKSTTIRAICGLLDVDRGSVRVLGKPIKTQRLEILAELGCIVDSPSLYPNLSATEFLSIGCILKDLPRSEIDRVLDIVGLGRERKLLIARYSLGMRQRLAMAHALLGRPKLLLLDEPTNGLDPEGIQDVRRLLRELPASADCTIFFASHLLSEVEKTATHLALLNGGSVKLQTSIGELTRELTGMLAVSVCDSAAGTSLLAGLGYATRSEGPHRILVTGLQPHDAARVNASLVQAGLDLRESSFSRLSLEEWFLQAAATGREEA